MLKLICGEIFYNDGEIAKNQIVIIEGYIIINKKLYRNYFDVRLTNHKGEYYFFVKHRSHFYRVRILQGQISNFNNIIKGE